MLVLILALVLAFAAAFAAAAAAAEEEEEEEAVAGGPECEAVEAIGAFVALVCAGARGLLFEMKNGMKGKGRNEATCTRQMLRGVVQFGWCGIKEFKCKVE